MKFCYRLNLREWNHYSEWINKKQEKYRGTVLNLGVDPKKLANYMFRIIEWKVEIQPLKCFCIEVIQMTSQIINKFLMIDWLSFIHACFGFKENKYNSFQFFKLYAKFIIRIDNLKYRTILDEF